MASEQETTEAKRLQGLTVSRRGFLRAAGVIGGAAFLGGGAGLLPLKGAKAAEDFDGYASSYGVLTDMTMCIGCRICEMACAQEHNLPAPPASPDVFNTQRRPSAQARTVVNRFSVEGSDKPVYRKMQCMHCSEPACASACLVAALKKTPEGAVVYNENLCMGCRYCMIACPFSNLAYDYDSVLTPAVKKCTMCFERIRDQGLAPACATACPPKATIFGKRSDLLETAHERIRQNPDKYVNHVYGEFEVGGTSWLYLSAVPFDKVGLPTNLGRTPYPEFTRDFLLAVPLVLMMWPGALAGLNAALRRKEQSDQAESSSEHKEVRK